MNSVGLFSSTCSGIPSIFILFRLGPFSKSSILSLSAGCAVFILEAREVLFQVAKTVVLLGYPFLDGFHFFHHLSLGALYHLKSLLEFVESFFNMF